MIGIDIENVERFKNLNEKELKRIFTEKELEYCLKFKSPYEHLGGMWCIKEATIKALKNKNIKLKDIEILHDSNGAPYLNKEKISKYLMEYSVVDISISHTNSFVVGVVQII